MAGGGQIPQIMIAFVDLSVGNDLVVLGRNLAECWSFFGLIAAISVFYNIALRARQT
jgi:hypothetical protein